MSKLIILLFFGIGFVIFTIIKSASKGISSAHRVVNQEPESKPGISKDELVQGVVQRSQKWENVGKDIAQDCFDNGLKKGEIVRHSQIQELIQKHHPYQAQVVEHGFLDQMKNFIQCGEVINFSAEGGDIVFVHRNHAKDLLNG